MEANVGCEKTHYRNRTWTLRCEKGDQGGNEEGWADEISLLGNWRMDGQGARRPFLYKEEDPKPNH